VAFAVYREMNIKLEAPAFGRTIHPAPPDKITVHQTSYDLVTLDNPYRPLQTSDPEAFGSHLASGRRVYYQNCVYCHGDALRGDGMYSRGLNPIPTNFADAGAIALLQESFLFWRISKGGPGLPEEGGPWDTAMPAWEKFLTEEEIWDVVLFLYDFSGQRPRAREGVHE
jgi:mono/diheme cytochrome c family protein